MAALIFDLDGTLVDTLPDLTAALNAVLAELARPPLALAQVRGMVGDGARVLVGRALAATGASNGAQNLGPGRREAALLTTFPPHPALKRHLLPQGEGEELGFPLLPESVAFPLLPEVEVLAFPLLPEGEGARRADEGEKWSPNPDLLGKALERFLSIYGSSPSKHSQPYPGVPEILHTLRQAGHRLGICTNKPEGPTTALLAALDLAAHFDAVLGGDTLPVRKPDPEHVQATMRLLGGTPDSTVMIGDSANDLQAAHAAGIPVVLVRWGYSTVPVDTLGAEAVIDTFADLPAALDAVLGAKP